MIYLRPRACFKIFQLYIILLGGVQKLGQENFFSYTSSIFLLNFRMLCQGQASIAKLRLQVQHGAACVSLQPYINCIYRPLPTIYQFLFHCLIKKYFCLLMLLCICDLKLGDGRFLILYRPFFSIYTIAVCKGFVSQLSFCGYIRTIHVTSS